MHPIAAMLACNSFEAGMSAARKRRQSFINALDVLSGFESVSSTFDQRGSAFYHCPFQVDDDQLFEKEFSSSALAKDYHFRRAPFVPLPQQLTRAGMGKMIKTSTCPRLEDLVGRLYLLMQR